MLKLNSKQTRNQRFTLTSFSRCLLGCSLLALGTQTFASNETKSDTTDSVFAWGMWEYTITPAAGNQHTLNAAPLNPRSAKVTLRTNSNSALAPTAPNSTVVLAPNTRPPAAPAPAAPAPAPPIIITQAPPAPPAATPPTPISPPPAPNIGTSPGAAPISGTPLNLGF